MRHLDILHKNVYTIGDLSMLEYVKNSIAIENSNPLLFDLVSFVTKDTEEYKINYALKHYKII